MTLQSYSDQLQEAIQNQEAVLSEMAKKIEEMQMQLRWDKKRINDQQGIAKEFETWYKQGKKLMEDLCGAFPKEALQSVVAKVSEITEEVAENYEEIESRYTYLLRDMTTNPEPVKALEAKVESKPEPNKAIKVALEQLEPEVLKKVAQMVGTRATKPINLAEFMTDMGLSFEDVQKMIETAQSLMPKLLL